MPLLAAGSPLSRLTGRLCCDCVPPLPGTDHFSMGVLRLYLRENWRSDGTYSLARLLLDGGSLHLLIFGREGSTLKLENQMEKR